MNAKIERGKTPERGRTPMRDTKINNAVRRVSVMVYSDKNEMDEFELQNLSIGKDSTIHIFFILSKN